MIKEKRMLSIHVDERTVDKECWDSVNNKFFYIRAHKEYDLKLEHSLISIHKWEQKWHIPFIKDKHSDEKLTPDQTMDYIKCMTLNQDVPDSVYEDLTAEDFNKISEYMNDPMTATVVKEAPGQKKSGRRVTAELIYCWMIQLNIPTTFDKWHINSLMQLIAVCNAENTPPKKMSKNEIIERNRALNEARKAKYHTKG